MPRYDGMRSRSWKPVICAVLAHIAEADGLDEVSLEEHGEALSVSGATAASVEVRDQTAHRHAVLSTLPCFVCFEHKCV